MGIIEYIGSIGGISGIFAVAMFLIYRQDKKSTTAQMREDRKYMEDRLTSIIKDYNEASYSTRDTLLENTKVLSELITLLKAKNGSK